MALQSPEANLLNSLIEKIAEITADEKAVYRYIEQDLGQLENYEMRPAVAWPCALIDIEELQYTDMQNHLEQMATGIITIRVGLVKYTDASNLTPVSIRDKAFQFYEVERRLCKALHGWAPEGFGKLLRRAAGTERRDDDIRVRVIKFAIGYTDDIGKKTTVKAARPDALMGLSPNS
jgi:hypothetical protein